MEQRESHVGDGGVEVIGKALYDRGQVPAIGLHKVGGIDRVAHLQHVGVRASFYSSNSIGWSAPTYW
jgi:hypothetical protein